MTTDKLTPKQEAFCLAYLETGNASEAYRRAYNAGNMSAESIKVAASRLMDKANVALTIDKLREAAAVVAVLSEARVLQETAAIAFSDPADLFDESGRLKAIADMKPEARAAIASVEIVERFEGQGAERVFVGYTKKIKLWDKNSAIDKLFRHLGSYERDNRQRFGMFDDVSTDTIKEIEAKLQALTGTKPVRSLH